MIRSEIRITVSECWAFMNEGLEICRNGRYFLEYI